MTADSNMVDAENYIMMAADRNGIKTDVELNNYIDGLAHLFSLSPFNLTPSQYEIVRKHVATKFRVKIVPGFTLSYEHEPWFYDAYNLSDKGFWKRYRTNLSKERSPTAIGEMDAFTNKVMDCCGNPSSDKPFERYGLVIGDVQSGKTSTYVGLMCKAADVKYDIFIVLTGMSNNLRRQTQVRIEEGFVGFKSDSGEKVGVGNINPSINAFSYTSLLDDFKGQISINASATKVSPIVLVVKKNSTVLQKVYNNLNIAQNKKGSDKIDYSLFLIDDEADNASINTREDSISTINAKIRQILNLFTKSTYIGFTATPYANVFIDPEADHERFGKDLFPRDFVSCIPTPANYIGPKDVFNPEGDFFKTMVRNNEDMNKCLPVKHLNGARLESIPESLSDAIDCYILACTMRDLEGHSNEPMSMMIHSSRFKRTQTSLMDSIADEYYRVRGDITNYSSLPLEKAMKNKTIRRLHATWKREYSSYKDEKYVWSEILKQMDNSLEKVKVYKINSESSDYLDYYNHPDLRAIVIGGNSLSRGLTLEGLLVTYFHRVSTQYDTLMQMGRWFGYRDEYADLCRIWISKSNAEWFAYIANATEELKNEVRTMELLGKTPEEHGLYVRQDIRGLHITSRNKMLHAGERIVKFSSSAVVWDTSRIFVDPNNLVKNSEACEVFLQKISDSGYEPHDSEFGNKIWNNIPRNFVTDFASSFAFDPHNEKPFPTLIDVINSSPEMEIWDVAIQNGSSDRNTHYGMKESKRNKYTTVLESDEISYIEFSQRRLISPTNTREGLEKGPENKEGTAAYITKNFGEGHKKTDGSPASPDAKAFLIPGRKPLLLIYYLDISEYEGDLSENPYVKIKLEEFSAYFKKNKDLNVIGLAFCFPDLGPGESKEPSIIITNKIYNMMKRNEEPDEESDEGDDI